MSVRRLCLVKHSAIRGVSVSNLSLCPSTPIFMFFITCCLSIPLRLLSFFLNNHLPLLAQIHSTCSLKKDKGADPSTSPLFLHSIFPYSSVRRRHAPQAKDFPRSSLLQDLKLMTRLSLALGAVAASGQQRVQCIQVAKTCSSELQNSEIII